MHCFPTIICGFSVFNICFVADIFVTYCVIVLLIYLVFTLFVLLQLISNRCQIIHLYSITLMHCLLIILGGFSVFTVVCSLVFVLV